MSQLVWNFCPNCGTGAIVIKVADKGPSDPLEL